jgi:hypothetical protein
VASASFFSLSALRLACAKISSSDALPEAALALACALAKGENEEGPSPVPALCAGPYPVPPCDQNESSVVFCRARRAAACALANGELALALNFPLVSRSNACSVCKTRGRWVPRFPEPNRDRNINIMG